MHIEMLKCISVKAMADLEGSAPSMGPHLSFAEKERQARA